MASRRRWSTPTTHAACWSAHLSGKQHITNIYYARVAQRRQRSHTHAHAAAYLSTTLYTTLEARQRADADERQNRRRTPNAVSVAAVAFLSCDRGRLHTVWLLARACVRACVRARVRERASEHAASAAQQPHTAHTKHKATSLARLFARFRSLRHHSSQLDHQISYRFSEDNSHLGRPL